MKFKFCGNVDCPDWLITEIVYLSKITPIKHRILGNLICKYIMKEGDTQKIKKMLEEMNLTQEEITIVISSLCFIIKSSAKFNVDDMMLSQELQQLGLPQDIADAISKVYKKNKDILRNYLKQDIFSFNRVSDVHYKTSYCLCKMKLYYNRNFFYLPLIDSKKGKPKMIPGEILIDFIKKNQI